MSLKKTGILCFYHPTSVLFLDDNEHFLHTIRQDFMGKINLQTLSNCERVLKILNGPDESIRLKRLILHASEDDTTQASQVVELNVSDLHKMIYHPSRFQEVSVLVVDYLMPEMSGIELCQKIQNRNVMKILLTAEADKDVAIDAFNQGLIHQYMVKTNDNLNETLLKNIARLQESYFTHLSQIMCENADTSFLAFTSSPEYLQLFEKTKKLSHAVEHYLLDRFGSILFLDSDASPTWLIWRNEQAMQEYEAIAQEQGAPHSVITALKRREKLLFQLTKQDMQQPIEQWQNYLFDVSTIDHKTYYSVIHSKTKNDLSWDRVISYSKK